MLQKPSVLKLVRILGQGGPPRFMTTKLWQCKATLHDARHYRNLYLYQKNLNAHIWILYELKGVHLTTYIDICDMQLQLQENDPVLKRMRRWWFIYKNIQRKWSWSRSEVSPQKTSKQNSIKQGYALSVVGLEWSGVFFQQSIGQFERISHTEIMLGDR